MDLNSLLVRVNFGERYSDFRHQTFLSNQLCYLKHYDIKAEAVGYIVVMCFLGVNMYEGTGVIRRTHGVLPGMHRRVAEDPYYTYMN